METVAGFKEQKQGRRSVLRLKWTSSCVGQKNLTSKRHWTLRSSATTTLRHNKHSTLLPRAPRKSRQDV
eukprot:2909457-Rhodomonas_salina.2